MEEVTQLRNLQKQYAKFLITITKKLFMINQNMLGH